MARRDHSRAEKGQIFAVEWPEWHVDCTVPACRELAMLCATGEAMDIREAERKALRNAAAAGDAEGWRRKKGCGICPSHASEA